MATIECNADLGHPCDADDGEPCPRCVEWLREGEREARREWAVASPAERDPVGYARDMVDAGRGHLLGPEER